MTNIAPGIVKDERTGMYYFAPSAIERIAEPHFATGSVSPFVLILIEEAKRRDVK